MVLSIFLPSSGSGLRHKWDILHEGTGQHVTWLNLKGKIKALWGWGGGRQPSESILPPQSFCLQVGSPPRPPSKWHFGWSGALQCSRSGWQTDQRCVSSSSSRSSLVKLSRGTIQLSPSSPLRLTTFFSCISEGVSITSKVGLSW